MAKMIQIRNVPDEVHRTLKARAAKAGMSLSDYLLREVRRLSERPTIEELSARVEEDGPAGVSTDAILAALHAGREER